MTYHDERRASDALTERSDEDDLETLDAWTLDDFDDLLYLANRSTHYPLHGGKEPYPS